MSNITSDIYQSVKVLVDSFYRNDPTSLNVSNFTYTLNQEISRVSRIYVESAQIPFTYFTTNATNNSLTIEYDSGTISAIVSPGNYNSGTIATAVRSALDSFAIPGVVWSVTFDPITFKLKITITGGSGSFKILVASDPLSIWPSVGFTQDTTYSAVHTSDGVMDLSGPRYLVIKSELIGENRAYTTAVSTLYTSTVNANTIIHTVPVNTNPGGVILDVAPSPRYSILGFKTSFKDNIDFRLEDDRGNLLDLNGNHWSVQFIFELR